jgi:three-Cys-motif partner protein
MPISDGRGATSPSAAVSQETRVGVTDDLAFDDFEAPRRWGGPWTLVKLETLKKYLIAYTNALKNQPFRLIYIDAFAGTGTCDVGDLDVHRGSASIALDVWPPFHEHIFIEQKAANCTQLQALLMRRQYLAVKDGDSEEAHPNAHVIPGDANEELARICAQTDWTSTRAVLFLDPFGMSVAWTTLQKIVATKAIDVWYLFPLNAVYRQLAHDLGAVDPDKRASLTRTLGTADWEREFYEQARVADLFGDERSPQRHADWRVIADSVTRRLRSTFVRVSEPRLLYHTRPGSTIPRAPLFALYFAVSNPSPAAGALAFRIAEHILKPDTRTVS